MASPRQHINLRHRGSVHLRPNRPTKEPFNEDTNQLSGEVDWGKWRVWRVFKSFHSFIQSQSSKYFNIISIVKILSCTHTPFKCLCIVAFARDYYIYILVFVGLIVITYNLLKGIVIILTWSSRNWSISTSGQASKCTIESKVV